MSSVKNDGRDNAGRGRKTLPYRTAFIVNPRAGKGRSLKVWQKVETLLRDARRPYQVYFTRCRGEGGAAAGEARARGAELIVSVGGDGTLLETVNGLDLKKNILGIIPAGTGNGFRRSLGIPGNARKALQGIYAWEPRAVDLGTVNGRLFLNVVGIGFDAAVARLATVDNRLLSGYPAYVSAFLAKAATFKSFPVTVHCGEDVIEERRAMLAVVANGSYYGGWLCIAPQARVDDGRLDLCLVRKTNAAAMSALAIRAFVKKHLASGAVHTASCTAGITVNAPEDIPVHLDGEITGSLPAKIGILPGALRVLSPHQTGGQGPCLV